jgi:gliding motility-associated-like protein
LQLKQFKSKNMMTTFIHSILFGKKPRDVRDPLGKKPFFPRLSFAFLLLLFFSINGNSQVRYDTTNWRFSNPKQFGFTVMDLDFVDDNNVIAVGDNGGIAKSRDGGVTWTYGVFSFVNANGLWFKPILTDVHYITSTIAYAVGSGVTGVASSPFKQGVMIKTTDGGATWSQVNNPLNTNQKNAYTCWFVNQNVGYIGGDWNTADSIPKVYFTNNGGANWDSLVSPSGTQTRLGYITNPNLPAQTFTVTGKAKEIRRIMFLDQNTGYVSGNAAHTSFSAPVVPVPNANTSTCLPTGTFTNAINAVSLVWKFSNGTLIDYSTTKERLGYDGVPSPAAGPITCTSRYITPGPGTQVYSAMHIINDSAILLISSNNNVVLRVYTGKNDSTLNVATGLKETGRYEILNATGLPTGYPTIPAVNPLFSFQQPREIRKASNGKLFVPVGSPVISPINRMMTSVDTGRTWREERNLPTGRTYSNFGPQAIDIAPNGKFLVAGTSGVVADSIPGGTWSSTYVFVSAAGERIEFADCNNGMIAGTGGNITVTTDGGKTWVDKSNAGIGGGGFSIFGMAYPTTSKAYFAVNNGVVYSSTDRATTLDPAYTNSAFQMRDVAAIGNDTVWVVGNNTSAIPAASRTSKVFRSVDGGLTWTVNGNFPVGSLSQTFTEIEFPSRQVGYVAGNRDTIWKTTDAGATWFKLPLPSPGNPISISNINDMFALDDNTVFLVGFGFGATTRNVVYKTTDGGNTWTDINSNIGLLMGASIGGSQGNSTVMFHDANNGYVCSGTGSLFKTTNGGTSWTLDYAPSGGFVAMAFAPKKVPAAISFANRKLFLTAAPAIMEYGNPTDVNVNTTETVTNATCTNLTAGSITINATGGLAPYTYSINGGAFQSSNLFTGLTQGAKTITIKDAFCGTLTKTVIVGFTDNLVLTTNRDTAVCSAEPVPMLASTNGTGASFAWTPTAGLSNPAISNPVATVTANAAYTVTATLNGCIRSNTVNIVIRPKPIISAGPDKTIVDGDKVTLEGAAIAPVFMTWTPSATLTFANTLNPVAKPNITTTYTLLVRNGENCTSTDDMIVTVIPYCAKVMDAFTPNGDGTNDRWIVSNGTACYTQVSVSVFNRYGGEVYKNANYQNNWEGIYNGKPVADGTYYYVVTYKLINGHSITLKGDVTILR